MPISWNEIETRASAFINSWKERALSAREEADAQTFENDFLNIFGVTRHQFAIFEHKVEMTTSKGYIDLLWKGHILIEMKSPGKNMVEAFEQAKKYANALPPAELPKGILICDFNKFHYYSLEKNAELTIFNLVELVNYVELFSDIAGYKDVEYKKLEEVNLEAAKKMGKLHDRLKDIGYTGHQLEVYLVRLLFCLFADDTGIFEPDHFIKYIIQRTNPDGSDLGLHLHGIFEVLNDPIKSRQLNIDVQLNQFPYVNGGLFQESLRSVNFDSAMREALIECCQFDWSKISPAIFGSMFQSVMNEVEQHDLGQHYTSEENILKLIHPLFLDNLWAEFEECKNQSIVRRRMDSLNKFHDKLASLKFLDPACGCGNFLVVTYREIRTIELAVIKELLGKIKMLDVDHYIKVNVNQFYGIEIVEFPCQVAQVALWLMDHQMNIKVRDTFGEYFVRIPLVTTSTIVNTNALQIDWNSIVRKDELSFILGNPPFLGARIMSPKQKSEVLETFNNLRNCRNLDYVSCWYKKAAKYIQDSKIEVAFVSTNSICQGEQVPILWKELIINDNVKINFAHQTFKWSNEARNNAAVYCVIVGFSLFDRTVKQIFHYATVKSEPVETTSQRINPYLIDAPTVFIEPRNKPICDVPILSLGNQPIDGGNYLFTKEEKDEFIKTEPLAEKWFRVWLGAHEFINGYCRYFLFLKNCPPNELRKMLECIKRVELVRKFRLNSTREVTRKLSENPMEFAFENIPESNFIVIPEVSSEKRKYIPIRFLTPDILCSNLVKVIPNANIYHFGILTSTMHMAWVRYTCGRMKSDYRYSGSIIYNNFPWPTPTDKQKIEIESAAQAVLDARLIFPNSSLADLYEPISMPPELVKAHQKLDKVVEKAYDKKFDDDASRVAFLFELYQKMTAPPSVST